MHLDLALKRRALSILPAEMRREVAVALGVGRSNRRAGIQRFSWLVDAFRGLHQAFIEPLAVRVERIAVVVQAVADTQKSVIVGVIAPALGISEGGPLEVPILQLLAQAP